MWLILQNWRPSQDWHGVGETSDITGVSVQGVLGGGKRAYLFRWAQGSDGDKWALYLEAGAAMERIGLTPRKPTNEDMEDMVHNASAAKSPLAAGAKLFGKLTKGLREK